MDRRQFLASAGAAAAAGVVLSLARGADTPPAPAKTPAPPAKAARPPGDTEWHDVRTWGVEGRGFDDTESYFDRLPARCREVVWLRRVEELSQREVAERLGITEKTVEKHIAKGMRLLADRFLGSDDAPRMRRDAGVHHRDADDDARQAD